MPILTLTTDLGYRDPYLAIVKARLATGNPGLTVMDLSCDLRENHISDAAYILRNALPHFPDGTIHLAAVKFASDRSNASRAGQADNSRFLVTEYKRQFIVSPDNGLFTLIDPQFAAPVYQVYYQDQHKRHFFLKDIFVDVALHLASGKEIGEIASPAAEFYRAFQFESYLQGNVLRGKGIYVDDFGNIVTNISRESFLAAAGKRNFTITLPGARLNTIYETYEEVKYGAPLVLFNSFGYLEVAANGRSAYQMLCPRDIGAGFDFNLWIEFHD
jgi:S-adenosylmethionine hydrolase